MGTPEPSLYHLPRWAMAAELPLFAMLVTVSRALGKKASESGLSQYCLANLSASF